MDLPRIWILLLLHIVVIATRVTSLEQEFEFEDSKTLIDDEDMYQSDDGGSGPEDPDEGVEGSGGGETPIFSTQVPNETPIFPPGPGGEYPEFYRTTVNFTSLAYSPELRDRNTPEFERLAADVAQSVESLFYEVPGSQEANVLQFRPGSMDPLVAPSLIVTMDLGTTGYYNRLVIFNILNQALSRGIVGAYRVSPEGFKFKPLSEGGQTPSPRLTCSPAEFRCNDGACIDWRRKCDGNYDCPDRSDEYDCGDGIGQCGYGKFECRSGECIEADLKCDGQFDCLDRSDENDCPVRSGCADDELQCSDLTCVPAYKKCDGVPDCIGAEDEADCAFHECLYYQFKCANGICIDSRLKCDGKNDCADGSDENCGDGGTTVCKETEFACNDGSCIDARRKCNGYPECADGSDEIDCGFEKCAPEEFQCNNGRCLDVRRKCNGYDECGDGSDEIDCGFDKCSPEEFQCNNGRCLDIRRKCNGYDECGDNSDEIDCGFEACPPGEFKCGLGRCIDARLKCNGYDECGDGSDEAGCDFGVRCSESELACDNGRCIDARLKCNGYDECGDGSDELDCGFEVCPPDQLACDNGRCLPQAYKCNGYDECGDGSDEIDCGFEVCPPDQFQCDNGRCLPQSYKCNGYDECGDGSDEIECALTGCDPGEFQCNNGLCIDERRKCNTYDECGDNSDEIDCEFEKCSPEEFQCNNGRCLDIRRKCNGYDECGDGSDEVDCAIEACLPEEFQCKNGRCLDVRRKCNGYDECGDGSDEIDCGTEACSPGEFQCNNGRCIDERRKCNSYDECGDGSDEIDCAFEKCTAGEFQCNNGRCLDVRRKCNGYDECGDGSDEIDCEFEACAPGEFQCNNGRCMDVRRKCNGYDECGDGSDEIDCAFEKCPPEEFQCNNGRCLDVRRKCNGYDECGDGSDEIDCDVEACSSDQFECQNSECIDSSQKCDGSVDCEDGSDEIDCGFEVCTEDQLECNNGNCIDIRMKCNGFDECGDGSDEIDCGIETCQAGEFQCENNVCLSWADKCDGQDDCGDGSDEIDCGYEICVEGQFQCNNGRCIDERRKCNGYDECGDNSDEIDCAAEVCTPDQLQCNNGRCIDIRRKCNGYDECGDGSDEIDCDIEACAPGEFQCNNGRCMDIRRKCNGYDECGDGSDEIDCDFEACAPGEFQCNNGRCMDIRRKCNGYDECGDGSDEIDCDIEACLPGQFQCNNGRCLDVRAKCNGYDECGDNSDEIDCAFEVCGPAEFECNNGRCIDSALTCNGNNDCGDNSDEAECANTGCGEFEFRCKNGQCINALFLCDEEVDCEDGSDEEVCGNIGAPTLPPTTTTTTTTTPVYTTANPSSCAHHEFACANGLCIDVRRRCNGYDECGDGSDEANCADVECQWYQFKCKNGLCIDQRRVGDGNRDCTDGSDENDGGEEATCSPYEFECANGACINQQRRCDSRDDCGDGSDERDCGPEPCLTSQFQCANGQCIDARQRCDSRYDCNDFSDERDCPSPDLCQPNEFRCEDGRCIDAGRRCDGRADCYDRSDEFNCSPVVEVSVSPTQLRVREGQEAVFQCRASGQPAPLVRWTKAGERLPVGASDVNGRLTISAPSEYEHAGSYVCQVIGLGSGDQRAAQASATLEVIPYGPTRGPSIPGRCGPDEATCQNLECVLKDYLCDGDFDCSDRSDEMNCANPMPCEPNEMQCTNGKCASKIWRCDGDDDCGDGSDEENCPTGRPGGPCTTMEFSCVAGNQCIPASYQCDGEIDCQDRSDEIGCAPPTVIEAPPSERRVSQGDTVVIECEAIGVPTPLIVWRLNWGHIGAPPRVSTTSVNGRGRLTITDARKEDAGAYTCEAINNKGSIFAVPDTILYVEPPAGICQSPYFNVEARNRDECARCFCFGATDSCVSSDLFISEIFIGNSLDMVTKDAGPRGAAREALDQTYVQFVPSTRSFRVDDYSRRVRGDYYWSLPQQFLGNKVTSYGGSLSYTIRYDTQYDATLLAGADVIISGNGKTLYHTQFEAPFAGRDENANVRIRESSWSEQPGGRPTSREELMTVLQNLDYILIKSNYDSYQSTVSISNIRMSTTSRQDYGLGRAVLVEDCACPTGYKGPSCEQCAEGFRRQTGTGLYLGQCSGCNCNGHSNDCDPFTGACRNCQHNTEGDRCDRCKSGYYGDARVGTPQDCLACPCPLTDPRNQFSRDCYREVDGEVTCRSCPPEYTGRRCERCAPGYEGNPMVPGDYCRPSNEGDRCDPRGSVTSSPSTGQCTCKLNTEGPTCATCRPSSFYLSDANPDGCVSCFCSGVTTTCTSTTWNRVQISSTFARDAEDFAITDRGRFEVVTRGVEAQRQRLSFRNFNALPRSEAYYWNLPAKFLRNKVTSYGGFLRYTAEYSPGYDPTPNSFYDIEISGNDVVLEYASRDVFPAGTEKAFQVPLYEHYWTRADGIQTTREHMLMALADLEYIMIKATYTASTNEVFLKDVSMDIAEDRNTGQDRAWPVEQCNCPRGYRGLSCEDCDVGFRRTGGGLYLGTCEECTCYGHSTDCDTSTGLCRNCQHNTEGERCDRCKPGYYGDATRGRPDDCQPCPCPLTTPPNQFSSTCRLDRDGQVTCDACPAGYAGRRCDSCQPGYQGNPNVPGDGCRRSGGGDLTTCNCDDRGVLPGQRCDINRRCSCKTYVEGENCGRCRAGYFHLTAQNPQGCLKCYCSGVSQDCQSSTYYRDQIRPVFGSDGSHGFTLVTRRLGDEIKDGIIANARDNEVRFTRYGDVQEDRQNLFWNLPPRFRGNRVTSYGGSLRFSLIFSVAQDAGTMQPDVDIEIISGESRFYHILRPSPRPEETNTYEVPITEESFQQYDGTRPSRETFLAALANINAFLIRSSFHTLMGRSSLRDLSLDTAVPQNTGQEQALMVEDCQCPPGRTGLSCEACAPGYSLVPDPTNPGRTQCVNCRCNGHSTTCDPRTGACLNCQHNTEGDRCERCIAGYYGDPRQGPNACRRCQCPLDIPSNNFSPTCQLDQRDNRVKCDQCPEGYMGDDCGQCAPGYTGNPRLPGDACRRQSGAPQVQVSPKRASQAVGSSVTFRCNVQAGQSVQVQWTRADGRPLNGRVTQMPDNSLVIRDVASTDSGRYVCTAYSQFGRSQDDVSLTVLGDRAITVIVQDPKTQTIQEGATVVFTCMGISQNTYTLAWTRERGDMPRNARDNGQGLLTITRARPEDAGVYVCTGSNFYSVDDDRATLVVGGGSEAPTVRIEPRFLEVTVGEPVEFRCVATGRPEPTLEWTGGRDGRLSPAHTFTNGVFRLPAAQKSDEAQYYCKATNAAGSADIMTILYVRGDGAVPEVPEPESGPPSAVIDQPELKVPPGGDATLGCSTGRDSDVSQISYIEWTRLGGGQMPPGSRQEDGFLVIPNCRADYSGRYQCTITYVSGERSQALANLIVTTDGVQIAPTATIAEERQTVATGTSASIRCEVTGTPQPVITWSKAGGELGPNHRIEGNILRIVQAKVEDRGLYVCLAENVAGRAQATAIVEVERREAPLVELYPGPTVDLQQGGSGLFQCRATAGIPPPSIIWTRANNEDFTANTEIIDANGVIRFTDVTGAEAGSYVCTATNEVGSITATASVNIAGGLPRVSVSPQSPFNVNEGQRVSIECVADGDGAAPSVYWASARRVDTPVTGTTPGQGSAVLMMDRVTARDAGVYVCVATNRAGSTEVRFELRVVPGSDGPREGVDHISVSVIPQSLTLSEGQQADFRCTAIGNPTPQVSWEKRRGGVLPALHAVRGGRLIIQRVSEADAGEYACVAQSRAGRQEATVTLSVQVAPEVTVTPQSQVLRTGDRLSIQCIATGTPPVTVEWQRIGAALSSSASDRDGLLEIPLIMAGDAGAYKCVAVNDAGRAEAFADVELIVSPSAIVSPAVVERPAGSTVELRCETTGSPIPRVRWLKEGGELPEQVTTQNGVLTIYNARPEDSGRYVCQVTNEAGTTRDFAQLTVVGGPESPPSYRQQVQTVQVGDQVEINCAVTGTPRPVVRWVKVDGELPRQAELRDTLMLIPNIQPGDAGTYRCVASNAVGSVFAQVEILVEARPQIQMQRVEKTVSVGSRVTLECAATGSPQPTIQWRKKDGFLPRDHELSEGVLVIPNFQQEDAGEYVCIASNRFGSAQGVIVITIGELVPGFQQNPQSYIRYPTLQDAYLQFDIEIAFKPETTDGLILYNGQFGTGSGDFMSFGLRDGRPELRFDMGSGPAIISGDPVALDEWHVVRIKRRDVSGMLTVNGRDYPGKAPGSFRGLDLVEDMYMGGVPSYSAIARNAGFRTGFVGGISRLEISGKALDIGGSALELVGITNYPVCGSRPCQNGGRCRPAATNNGYMCECKSDFSGNQCELIGERCFPGACGDRGTCYDLPGGRGYRCACPVGKTGERCERGISVTEPAFNRTSYIAYPTMEDALMQTTIELVVKPRSLGPALLLYNAAGDDGRGDFISLIISSDGHVEFRFDSGSGPAVIRSTEALAVDRWTTIVAERNEVDGSLSLNGGVAVKGTSGVSPGTSIGLNLKAPMYIGGVEASVRVNPRAGAERGFHGCISQMKIKGRDIDLINTAIASEDIVDCGNAAAARPCDKRPCENGGQCLERNGGSSYTCICPADFTGTDCESEVNICSTRNPCRNGAECVATGDAADAFYCKCPIGYTGRTCNFESTIRTSAQYEGTGYVELPKALLPHTNNKAEEVIELAIRTSAPDGLIFWHGQRPDVPGSGKDFLAIAVQDGHVVFSFELGSGTANVTSAERVDDGRPHLITATRTGKYGGLTIDGFSFAEGESEGAMTTLNAIGNIYLGGVPAPALMTGGRFLAAFTGCITEVYIQGLGPLDLSLEAVSGVNVQACSNS